jgi:hypothetical protein
MKYYEVMMWLEQQAGNEHLSLLHLASLSNTS